MRNKKTYLVVAVVLAAILLGGPYLMGYKVREILTNHEKQLAQIPGYRLEIRDYKQGWFGSRLQLYYGFDAHMLSTFERSNNMNPEIRALLKNGLVFDVAITHGPVIFQQGVQFALMTLSGQLQDSEHPAFPAFKAQTGIDSLLHIAAQVAYDGATAVHAESPAFTTGQNETEPSDLWVQSGGMTADFALNAALDAYQSSLEIKHFKLATKQDGMTIAGMKIEVDAQRATPHIWLGTGQTVFDHIRFGATQAPSFMMQSLVLDYDLIRQSDDHIGLSSKVTMAALQSEDVLSIKDVVFNSDFNRIDLAALDDYMSAIKTSYNTADGQDLLPEAITRLGEQLIKASPELVVHHLDFATENEGFFKGQGAFSLDGQGLEDIAVLSNPKILHDRISLVADARFNEAFPRFFIMQGWKNRQEQNSEKAPKMTAEQIEKAVDLKVSRMIQSGITQGRMIAEGDHYRAHFSLKNGVESKPLSP